MVRPVPACGPAAALGSRWAGSNEKTTLADHRWPKGAPRCQATSVAAICQVSAPLAKRWTDRQIARTQSQTVLVSSVCGRRYGQGHDMLRVPRCQRLAALRHSRETRPWHSRKSGSAGCRLNRWPKATYEQTRLWSCRVAHQRSASFLDPDADHWVAPRPLLSASLATNVCVDNEIIASALSAGLLSGSHGQRERQPLTLLCRDKAPRLPEAAAQRIRCGRTHPLALTPPGGLHSATCSCPWWVLTQGARPPVYMHLPHT